MPARNLAGELAREIAVQGRGQPGPGRPPARVALYSRTVRDHAGSSRILLGLTRELSRAGHQVDIFAERLAPHLIAAHGGQPRQALPRWLPGRVARHLLSPRRRARQATAAVARGRYDLVIGNGELLDQDVVLLHNMVRREVEELRAFDDPRYLAMLAWQEDCLTGHGYRLLVANSRLMKAEVCSRYGLAADRVAVVHPAVDPGQFSRRDRDAVRHRVRQELGVDDGTPLIGFITSGNFRLRSADLLLEVTAALAAGAQPGLKVLAVCNEKNARGLEAQFRDRGLGRHLITRGKIRDVGQYFHAIDLLFHPARVEAFGLVVHEAAACGCPVVTSERVGAAELFTGAARLGITATPALDTFLPLVTALLADPARRAALAEAQWRQVHGRDWAVYSQELLEACATRGLA